MTPINRRLYTLLFIGLVAGGCVSKEVSLDPAGPYQGDAVLWTADKVIVQVDDMITLVNEFALRNPAVAQRGDMKAAIERINKLRDGVVERNANGTIKDFEVLAILIVARDAYAVARDQLHATEVQTKADVALLMLEQVRQLLPLFVSPAPVVVPEPAPVAP
jgi:hypothetical protein